MSHSTTGDDDDRAVPHGEAPGDDARQNAQMLIMSKGGPERVAIYRDANTDEWIEAPAEDVVEVRQ